MQKKRVLILGATGMLGHMLYKYLESVGVYELFNSVYRTPLNENSIFCNVKDQFALDSLFKKTNPDIVINCIGSLVHESKEYPTNAIYLNALLPHILKDLCNLHQAKLIHISTDCVFSGKKGSYKEDDFRDADDVYGRTKALGEILDLKHCTLRTSIIGPELKDGTGLFHWFMKQEGKVKGFENVFWSGVTTLELAKCINIVITNSLFGLYHVSNGKKISKYNLLTLIKATFGLKNIELVRNSDYFIDKSLDLSEKYNFQINSYEEMISQLKKYYYFNEFSEF
jgi:dTDP-4-dehydrorhamnose reductase